MTYIGMYRQRVPFEADLTDSTLDDTTSSDSLSEDEPVTGTARGAVDADEPESQRMENLMNWWHDLMRTTREKDRKKRVGIRKSNPELRRATGEWLEMNTYNKRNSLRWRRTQNATTSYVNKGIDLDREGDRLVDLYHVPKDGLTSECELTWNRAPILNPKLEHLVAVHKVIQSFAKGSHGHAARNGALQLALEVRYMLHNYKNPLGIQLILMLAHPKFRWLLAAHDKIAIMFPVTAGKKQIATMAMHGQYNVVTIKKTDDPLGATVTSAEDGTISIGRVIRGGSAAECGYIREGDEVVEVNGAPVRGMHINAVCGLIATSDHRVVFKLHRRNKNSKNPVTIKDNNELHLKALFDYSPDDDPYIPCKELGLAFTKGDILHVINRRDPDWWQAYRDGHRLENHLAGLVPSSEFIKKREMVRRSLVEVRPELMVMKGRWKWRRKTKPKVEFDKKTEILTYEPVSLYKPCGKLKRPIFIVSITGLGRHEIRQRIIEDYTGKHLGAVQHTSRRPRPYEQNGREYYFISKSQFEKSIDIFLDFYEYENNYFGTSLEAVRQAQSTGNICITNIQSQSVHKISSTDLKPCFVYISPPPYQDLKLRRTTTGEFLSNEQINTMMKQSREVESQCGHGFDYVLEQRGIEGTSVQLMAFLDKLNTLEQWIPSRWMTHTTGPDRPPLGFVSK